MTSCHGQHGQSSRCCSAACYAQTLLSPLSVSLVSDLRLSPYATLFMSGFADGSGAGEGNRTLVISLEGCCSTIELHPRGGKLSYNSAALPRGGVACRAIARANQ